jgi:PAS domain S-box-containing protein
MKEAMRESEEKYRDLFESAREAIVLIDLQGTITGVNRLVEDYGFKREELIGRGLFDFVAEDDKTRAMADFEVLLGGKPVKGEMEVLAPKGVVCVEYRDNPILRGDLVVGVQAILTDVTKHKRAEQLLREERDKAQKYLDIAGVILVVIDTEERVGLINKRGCEVLGYAEEEVLGKNWFDHFLPESLRDETRAVFRRALRGEIDSFERHSNPVLTRTGEQRLFVWHNTVLRDDNGEAVAVLSSGEDVTECRRAEEALRRSEERYRGIFENAVLGMYQTTPEGEILAANPALVRMLGYDTFEQLAPRNLEKEGFEPEHPRSLFKERMEADGQIVGLESAWKRRDGSTLWVRESARVVRDETGKTLFYEGTVEDITEHKHADQLMRTLATTAVELVELSPEADLFQFIADKVLALIGEGIVSVNSIEGDTLTVRQLTGATTVAMKLAQRLLGQAVIGMPIKGLHEVARTDLRTGKLTKVEGGLYELFFRTVPRPVCWTLEKAVGLQECHFIGLRRPGKLLGNVTILAQKGTKLNAEVIEALVNQASIALERRQAIETLLRSEERYRRLVTTATEGIFVLDRNHRFAFVNDRMAALLGYTPQEMLDKPAESIVFPQELADHAQQVSDRREGKKSTYERRFVRKDGQLVWGLVSAGPILDANGEFGGSLGMITDITERRRAKEALRESESHYRLLADNASDVIWTTDLSLQLTYCSPSVERVLGYTADEMLTKRASKTLTPASNELVKKVFAEEMEIERKGQGDPRRSRVVEVEEVRKDGTTLWVEVRASFLRDVHDKAIGVVGVTRDISKRREAEQQLLEYQSRLKELAAELTLAEERERRRIAVGVHDQIGQRLALAKLTLQSLQASTFETNTSRALEGVCKDIDKVLKDTHSLTFELSNPILYEVGFEPAVESWLLQQVHDRYGIECTFEADESPVELDKETRVVLFDVVREILTNVVKHAKAKHVDVRIRRINGNVQTSVQDDGVGFEPPRTGMPVSPCGGFGLFNIREKLDYLGGSITIASAPGEGTRVVAVAPVKSPRNSGKDRHKKECGHENLDRR